MEPVQPWVGRSHAPNHNLLQGVLVYVEWRGASAKASSPPIPLSLARVKSSPSSEARSGPAAIVSPQDKDPEWLEFPHSSSVHDSRASAAMPSLRWLANESATDIMGLRYERKPLPLEAPREGRREILARSFFWPLTEDCRPDIFRDSQRGRGNPV